MATLTEIEALALRIDAAVCANQHSPPMVSLLKDCARTMLDQQERIIKLERELAQERSL